MSAAAADLDGDSVNSSYSKTSFKHDRKDPDYHLFFLMFTYLFRFENQNSKNGFDVSPSSTLLPILISSRITFSANICWCLSSHSNIAFTFAADTATATATTSVVPTTSVVHEMPPAINIVKSDLRAASAHVRTRTYLHAVRGEPSSKCTTSHASYLRRDAKRAVLAPTSA